MDRPPLASRTLLFPGPQPPLTHLGATLLRHVVGSGARYTLYQLGLPVPESPPVRIARLRIYLDGGAIARLLDDAPGGGEVTHALLDPGGTAQSRLPGGPASAAALHRARLRCIPRTAKRRHLDLSSDWTSFRTLLSAGLPVLNDAFLAETVSALARRASRRRGRVVGPVMSRVAARWLQGRGNRLEGLGVPDPFRPSWASVPPEPATRPSSGFPSHPFRGRFRECYRALLDALRPPYLRLAERAVEEGLLAQRDDSFFIPLDLASDLELSSAPAWIEGAVAANRAEYDAELTKAAPPEVLAAGDPRGLVTFGSAGDWSGSPLEPLA